MTWFAPYFEYKTIPGKIQWLESQKQKYVTNGGKFTSRYHQCYKIIIQKLEELKFKQHQQEQVIVNSPIEFFEK